MILVRSCRELLLTERLLRVEHRVGGHSRVGRAVSLRKRSINVSDSHILLVFDFLIDGAMSRLLEEYAT
jgi:hypothetical protein